MAPHRNHVQLTHTHLCIPRLPCALPCTLPCALPALQRWGYGVSPSAGPLWKSTSGEYSNLRWDIPLDQVKFYWQQVGAAGRRQQQGARQMGGSRGHGRWAAGGRWVDDAQLVSQAAIV